MNNFLTQFCLWLLAVATKEANKLANKGNKYTTKKCQKMGLYYTGESLKVKNAHSLKGSWRAYYTYSSTLCSDGAVVFYNISYLCCLVSYIIVLGIQCLDRYLVRCHYIISHIHEWNDKFTRQVEYVVELL